MNAWAYRNLPDISYLLALVVALVALLYYFAATQVFPKAAEKDTLDHHIMENRRVVIFCVLASNVLTQIPNAISAFSTPWPMSEVVPWAGLNFIYYMLLGVAALAKSKATVGGAVGLAILFVTGVTLIFA
ncbi:hypothetical protein P6U16_22915 (plasmid) [Rhizobium sp. 32-5/1]|uniref:hypothetical protein n=1 Tax=Rhizobium sp. 32-5/1 TaxID=3019602 RepID=UPI00240D5CE5|nr:hypothetical protein [Rhizobium sp. 32-5/1]WEZ85854.1 hypothetical protein P6U16_22915 [Rhizobium sp. 32-5/1]